MRRFLYLLPQYFSPRKHLSNATFLSFGEFTCNIVSQKIMSIFSALNAIHEQYLNSLKNGI